MCIKCPLPMQLQDDCRPWESVEQNGNNPFGERSGSISAAGMGYLLLSLLYVAYVVCSAVCSHIQCDYRISPCAPHDVDDLEYAGEPGHSSVQFDPILTRCADQTHTFGRTNCCARVFDFFCEPLMNGMGPETFCGTSQPY